MQNFKIPKFENFAFALLKIVQFLNANKQCAEIVTKNKNKNRNKNKKGHRNFNAIRTDIY